MYYINRKRSEDLCQLNENKIFFKNRQNEIKDKLGLNSFLLTPVQRLPKYGLLLGQLIKEFTKQLNQDGVKKKIAACCRADKQVQRLLERVNTSMQINEIIDCNEVLFWISIFCFHFPTNLFSDKSSSSR